MEGHKEVSDCISHLQIENACHEGIFVLLGEIVFLEILGERVSLWNEKFPSLIPQID